MNIIEKYIEDKKSLVILISGFSGSGKTVISKSLAKDLKLEFVNLNDYYKDDFKQTIQVGNLNVITWDSPDAINWDKFNDKVNEIKNKGVIISGFAFPESKLKFHVNFHIHIKISKDDLIKNRQDYNSEKVDSKLEGIKDLTPEIEKRILNAISFPFYLELIKQSKFTKTINIEYGKLKDAYNDTFDYLIETIKKLL